MSVSSQIGLAVSSTMEVRPHSSPIKNKTTYVSLRPQSLSVGTPLALWMVTANRPLWASAEVGSQKQSMHIDAQTKLPMGEEALTLGREICTALASRSRARRTAAAERWSFGEIYGRPIRHEAYQSQGDQGIREPRQAGHQKIGRGSCRCARRLFVLISCRFLTRDLDLKSVSHSRPISAVVDLHCRSGSREPPVHSQTVPDSSPER